MTESIRQYRLRNREKKLAHDAVDRAMRAGELARLPCWICGDAESEAHHADYSRPLDVVWLCRDHHKQLHRETPITIPSGQREIDVTA